MTETIINASIEGEIIGDQVLCGVVFYIEIIRSNDGKYRISNIEAKEGGDYFRGLENEDEYLQELKQEILIDVPSFIRDYAIIEDQNELDIIKSWPEMIDIFDEE